MKLKKGVDTYTLKPYAKIVSIGIQTAGFSYMVTLVDLKSFLDLPNRFNPKDYLYPTFACAVVNELQLWPAPHEPMVMEVHYLPPMRVQ